MGSEPSKVEPAPRARYSVHQTGQPSDSNSCKRLANTPSVSGSGAVTKTADANMRGRVSWREQSLTFDNDSISMVIKQFSRYSDVKIVLEGDVRARRISGICWLDPDSLVAFLESDESLVVQPTPKGAIVRPR